MRRLQRSMLLVLLSCSCSGNGNGKDMRAPDASHKEPTPQAAAGSTPDSGSPRVGVDASAKQELADWDVDVFARACDALVPCPAYSFGIWETLLDAADFGNDAELRATSRRDVLVALGDGSFKVVRLAPGYEPQPRSPYQVWSFPQRDLTVLDVVGYQTEAGVDAPALALACEGAEATRCMLWRAVQGTNEMEPWPGTELPQGVIMKHLVYDDTALAKSSERAGPCVYGNGLLCLRDGWKTVIAPSPDLMLNDVALRSGARWALAVGEHGRWFKRQMESDGGTFRWGQWEAQPNLGDSSLTRAILLDDGGLIQSGDQLLAVVGSAREARACGPARAPAWWLGSGFLTQDGDLFVHLPESRWDAEGYCMSQHLTLPGPVLDSTEDPCGIADNARVLTARALIGQSACAND